jgi:hypothetical protein
MIRDRRHVYNEPALAFIGFHTRINYLSHRKQKFLTWPLLIAALLCIPGAVAAKQYKAAEIYTFEDELYGKYVFRMQAAKGSGLISAFFLWKDDSETGTVPWEEVDIEIFGKDNAETWQSNIITGTAPTTNMSEGDHVFSPDPPGDVYHTYTLEWSPGSVVWLLDGDPVRTVNGPPADNLISAAQIRFNVWPSESTEWAGDWDDDILPRYMYVDWVEYYPWNETAGTFEDDYAWRDDFDTFNTSRWGKANWTFDGNRADYLPENAYVAGGRLYLRVTDENADDDSSSDNDDDYDSGGGDSGGYGSGGGGCPWIVMATLSLFLARRKSR